MNKNAPISEPCNSDPQQAQRFVRWVLVALIVSSIGGLVSVVTNVTSFNTRFGSSGTTTTLTHHTLVSRTGLAALCIFQAALSVSIFRRSRSAWRAAFALPLLWTSVVGMIGWHQIAATSPDWTAAIPYAFLAGLAIWKMVAWRRQWASCEGLFQ